MEVHWHKFKKKVHCLVPVAVRESPLKVSVKEKVPTEKNSSGVSIFATKASYISN